MKLSADQLGHRVYLDANIYIYALEGSTSLTDAVAGLLDVLEAREAEIIGSLILLPELLAKPLRMGREDLAEAYKGWLLETPQIQMVPVSEAIIWRATAMRAEHGLKTIDALHLATAVEHGCDCLVTNDRGFPRIDDLRVLDLSRDTFR